MKKRPIRHRVERTRNKHSRAVLQNDTIIIRLAKNLSKTEEREHIKDLLRRMTRHVLDERRKIIINPFREILDGAQEHTVHLATGKDYTFRMYPGKNTHAIQTIDGWLVFVGPHTNRKGLHSFLWSLLSDMEAERMDTLVRRINEETFDKRISKVRLKFASTQWGSCSPSRVIMLNTAMLFVPPSCLRYVIVHELAHTLRGDHSDAFWRIVEEAMPTAPKAMKTLQEYRLPTL